MAKKRIDETALRTVTTIL